MAILLSRISPNRRFETSLARCGDTLLHFILHELSTTKDCHTRSDAILRLASAAEAIDAIIDTLHDARHETSPQPSDGRRQDKERHRPGHKRPAAAKGTSRGRYARPPRSRRKRRLCTGRPSRPAHRIFTKKTKEDPMNTSDQSKHLHPRQAVSLLRPHRLHARLIISSGSRPAFGRTAPNPSISVQQTHARRWATCFRKWARNDIVEHARDRAQSSGLSAFNDNLGQLAQDPGIPWSQARQAVLRGFWTR